MFRQNWRSLLLAATMLVLVLSGSLASWSDRVQAGDQDMTLQRSGQSGDNELVAGNNAFAFDLYQAISEEGDNLIFSPYSISLALAMTYAGARGETEQQIADTLHFTLPQDELHPAFSALNRNLPQEAEGEDAVDFRLHMANAIWAQENYPILAAYLDLLDEYYDAGLKFVDFMGATEEARITINNWVSDETEDRIQDLLQPGVITPLTTLVLTNAIYFKAQWLLTFDENITRDRPFTLLDGEQVTVPMMTQIEQFAYMTGDGYQAIRLQYEGERMAMLILLPDAGQFEAIESQLDPDLLNATLNTLEPCTVHLTVPRFEYESDFSLTETLKAMGMPVAFSGGADFSGMTGTRGLFISDVIHKAFVKVDEEGTEAAAATAVVMGRGGGPADFVQFWVDRPFIYVIYDQDSGAILFLGRVVNPAE